MKTVRASLPLLLLALSACATGSFQISAAEQEEVEEAAIAADMAATHAEGLQGTWIGHKYDAAICRWSPSEPGIAVCRTRYHRGDRQWFPVVKRYRRDPDGDWQEAPNP